MVTRNRDKNQRNCFRSADEITEGHVLAVSIQQREVGCFLSDPRRSRRGRHLPQLVEKYIGKEPEHQYAQRSQNRSEDFAAINLRFAKCPEQTQHEKNSAGSKQQEIRPRKITGDWELRKECVAEKTS